MGAEGHEDNEGREGITTLTSARGLMLTPLTQSDGDDLHALFTSPGVRRFLWDDEIIPRERTREVIEKSEELFRDRAFGLWGVRRPGDPRLVGFTGFWYFRDPPVLELLYGIDQREWGRGHAVDAAAAVIAYGFGTLGMPLIRATTDVPNVASIRVLEKLGFRQTRRECVGSLDTLFFERQRAS